MDVWRFISDKLNENIPVELLYVLQSEGVRRAARV